MHASKKSAVFAVMTLAITSSAYAATQWPPFTDVDKDQSGMLDKKEAKSVKGLDLKSADADRDGKISQTEYDVAMTNSAGSASGSGVQ